MVIVDTSVIIDLLAGTVNPQTIWLNHRIRLERIGITTLTYCEVLQGIRNDYAFLDFTRDLNRFEILEAGSRDLALASASNFRALRKRGITIRNTIDCLIATYCIQGNHSLLHNGRDFDGFEKHLGLEVVQLF